MDKLRTKTGKEFDCNYFTVLPTQERVYIRIRNLTLAQVTTVFSNPAETVQLWYGENYLAHYTRLIALVPEQGAIKVVLGKE